MGPRYPVDLPDEAQDEFSQNWESNQEEFEEKISDLLQERWTINIDPNLLYAYGDEENPYTRGKIGGVTYRYFDAFVQNLEDFIKDTEDHGREELNSSCSNHEVALAPQDDDSDFKYGGLEIKDGQLRMVFNENKFGFGISETSRYFEDAIKAAPSADGAPRSGINFTISTMIENDYPGGIEEIEQDLKDLTGLPDLVVNPNWEHNASKLAAHAAKTGNDWWDQGFVQGVIDYFEVIRDELRNNNWEGDDLKQEGFQDFVTSNEICVRVADRLKDPNADNELILENGVLYIQTTPDTWTRNTYGFAYNLMNVI
ncbi:hypothetical protein FQN57_004074 [Myotisia sp. PD_48]|nr:hypothetical protein FQN57_004074 [Myotisia sp. PD_48]